MYIWVLNYKVKQKDLKSQAFGKQKNVKNMSQFNQHVVNKRFAEVYKYLENNQLIRSKSDLARYLETYNHVISSILQGKRNLTLDQCNKMFQHFGINANYLFGLSDVMLASEDTDEARISTSTIYDRKPNITLVTEPAMAGYALAHNDPAYLDNLQKFSVPGLEGQLIAFEIFGDSMHPTITHGDLVVCQLIERTEPIRENSVYVVVSDVVVAKRIQPIKEGGHIAALRLISDNNVFQPYEVDAADVRQILKVKCRLTRHGII